MNSNKPVRDNNAVLNNRTLVKEVHGYTRNVVIKVLESSLHIIRMKMGRHCKDIALIRLDYMNRKFRRDRTYQEHNKTFRKVILKEGNAEPITSDSASEKAMYISHKYHPW